MFITYKVPTQITVGNIVELKNVASTLQKREMQVTLFVVTVTFVEHMPLIPYQNL